MSFNQPRPNAPPSMEPPLEPKTRASMDSATDESIKQPHCNVSTDPIENVRVWQESVPRLPIVYLLDSKGNRLPVQEENSRKRSRTPSDTGESETVRSISDLGFAAASQVTRPTIPAKANNGTSIRKFLEDAIDERLKKSQSENEDYLPISEFEGLFNQGNITSLIHEAFPKASEEALCQKVAEIMGQDGKKSCRRILAILTLMDKVDSIDEFLQNGIADGDFILEPGEFDRVLSRHSTSCTTTEPSIYKWKLIHRESFGSLRRCIFVPFFNFQDGELCSYALGREARLPWHVFEQKTEGGHGIVRKVMFDEAHHNYVDYQGRCQNPYFALKEIASVNRKVYHDELRALERCCAKIQKEKHLIKLLLTFQHGDKYYLLFEWADGNLQDLFDCRSITPSPENAYWATLLCLGIATAIKRIHGLATFQVEKRKAPGTLLGEEKAWGRHGDIKPGNILWFSTYEDDRDLLVVSDLGLARYHSYLTKSLVTQVSGLTRNYRPPEVDLGKRIGQRYDIWSLGCVYLQFCIWYLEGSEQLGLFGLELEDEDQSPVPNYKESKFFNIITYEKWPRPVVKQAVIKRIQKLKDLELCPVFSRGLLGLIETRMLVVNPEERAPVDQLCKAISDIRDKLKEARPNLAPGASGHILEEVVNVDQTDMGFVLRHTGGVAPDNSCRRRSLSIQSFPSDLSEPRSPEDSTTREQIYLDNYLGPRSRSSSVRRLVTDTRPESTTA